MSGLKPTHSKLITDASAAGRTLLTAAAPSEEITLTERTVVFLSAAQSDASAALGVVEFNVHQAMSLSEVIFECDADNPPTGSAAQMDLLKNGTTVFSTNPTIDAGESSSETAATASVLSSDPTSIASGDNLEFDLDQIGASNTGQGYYATLIFTRTNV